ncbi:MAG TPA: hypothetical protein VJ045_07520 [Hyphomicrobiaceae bacterium]|nr:hypothetical protein [Hyphomicrobiaceae bacterium]
MQPATASSELAKSKTYRVALTAALLLAAVSFPISQASALSNAVKVACLGDYLSYCSSHQVGSPQLRQCMSAAGPKLSRGCVSALIAAGEVSQAEVSRRAASLR